MKIATLGPDCPILVRECLSMDGWTILDDNHGEHTPRPRLRWASFEHTLRGPEAVPLPESDAEVVTALSHAHILSDKSGLAYLQTRMPNRTDWLETDVVYGRAGFELWCRGGVQATWIVKDALANGGRAIWIFDQRNWREVAGLLEDDAEAVYVVQRYVQTPALWSGGGGGGNKYHLRCYAVVTGDGRAFLFDRAFAHVANRPWTEQKDDREAGTPAAADDDDDDDDDR